MNARRKKAILEALVKYDHTGSYDDYEELIHSVGITWDDFNKARDQYKHKQGLKERSKEAAK
jgi:hypothetical protein